MDNVIADMVTKFAEALNSSPLVVFFISMLPIVEVRGGIPAGIQLGLEPYVSFGYSILASMVVVPVILFLLKIVIRWMCKSKIFGNFGKALNSYFYEKAQKVENGKIVASKQNIILKYLALFLFVAAPLPLTGFWTGSAIAVFMNLNPMLSFIVILLGNLVAGGLIIAMSLLLGENAIYITIVFLIFVPIVFLLLFYKLYKKKKQSKSDSSLSAATETNVVDSISENEDAIEPLKSEKERNIEKTDDLNNLDTAAENDYKSNIRTEEDSDKDEKKE